MEKGILYHLGRSSVVHFETGEEVRVETLEIDTETDLVGYVKIDGELMQNTPEWAERAVREALLYQTRITEWIANEWLTN